MKISLKVIFLIITFFLILGTNSGNAGLGQAAGKLGFGDIPRGGQETLSYGVINNGNAPIWIKTELWDEISKIATVEPKTAQIPPTSYIAVYVTVKMPRNVSAGREFKGQVVVKEVQNDPASSGGGAFSFGVAVVKNIDATAGEEFAPPPKPEPPKPAEPPYFAIFILAIIGILFLYRDPFGWRAKKKKSR